MNLPALPLRLKAASLALRGLWPRWGGGGSAYRSHPIFLPGARMDHAGEAGVLWLNPVVALGLKWLGDRFPKPPIRVCRIARDGQHVPLPRHPLSDMWNRPNAHYSRRTLEMAVGLSLVCEGTGYVHKRRNKGGRLIDLWYVPHTSIKPTWPEDGSEFVDGWEVEVDGEKARLPYADVLQFRTGIDPQNPRLGLSPLKACLREVCTVNEASGFTAALLRNSGVPGLMVLPDDPTLRPSKADADGIKERIRDAFTGENRGDTVVLGGKYRVESVGFSPEQLRLDRLPQMAMATVASAVGVDLMSLGLPDPNKTYSNLAEANRASWATVTAAQDAIAETLRWGLLPEFGHDPHQYTVEYDYTAIAELNEDRDRLHARIREDARAGLLTQAAAQELLGYDVDPDGDRYFPGTFGDEPEPMPMLPAPGEPPATPSPGKPEPGKKNWSY